MYSALLGRREYSQELGSDFALLPAAPGILGFQVLWVLVSVSFGEKNFFHTELHRTLGSLDLPPDLINFLTNLFMFVCLFIFSV